MVFLIEFPIETESPLVLWEDCTPKMSDRCYSELWCGGVVAQMQSIQQTGFLGIRQGVKKPPICAAVGLTCLFAVWFLLSHAHGKACGSVCYSSRLRQQKMFSLPSNPSKCSLSLEELRGEGNALFPPSSPLNFCETHKTVLHPSYTALSQCWPSSSSSPRLEQIINPSAALVVWVLRDWSQQEARTVLQGFSTSFAVGGWGCSSELRLIR